MATALEQHQVEIQRNRAAWEGKALLREIYAGFYERIVGLIDQRIAGAIVEVGSGIGNLRGRLPGAIATDLFPNPWLDLVCDGYELPFGDGSVSHLILFDVFHHLRAPMAFLGEARRALAPGGRVIVFEPYISAMSYPVYGLLHHEPVALKGEINMARSLGRPRDYYAAQGNATRMFFATGVAANGRRDSSFRMGTTAPRLEGWRLFHAEAFASFAYLLSGGFSKPAVYSAGCLKGMECVDRKLSRWPRLFGARCLVGLEPVKNPN
jgi:SAM-dependent methyltransferase